MDHKLNDEVVQMVRDELSKDREVPNEELIARAVKLDPTVNKLSARQFHAKYRMLVLREGKPTRRTRRSKGDKTKTREVLLGLVKTVAAADKQELVDIVANIDTYIKEMEK